MGRVKEKSELTTKLAGKASVSEAAAWLVRVTLHPDPVATE